MLYSNNNKSMINANHRILAIDDDESVLDTYRVIFSGEDMIDSNLNDLYQDIGESPESTKTVFNLTTASNGETGIEYARHYKENNTPFALAFIDMRMPNGIDGLETAKQLRKIDNQLYIVIVSAYSDHDFDTIRNALDQRVIYISKPFHHIEIEQIAFHHCNSWQRDRMLDSLLQKREETIRQQGQMFELFKTTSSSVKNSIQFLNFLSESIIRYKDEEKSLDDLISRERAEMMNGQIQKILNLMESSLLGARSDAPEASPLPVKSTISQISEVFDVTTLGRSAPHILECNIPENTTILMSLVNLQTILLNLLNNAAEAAKKYVDELHGSVRQLEHFTDLDHILDQPLIILSCDSSNDSLTISVKNTGKPIPEDVTHHLFERNFTTKPDGNGLGLNDVYQLVTEAGGSVHHENSPRSVTFKVILPLRKHTL